MNVTLTITDLTRMSGDRVCIAGITPSGHNLRPEFEYDGIQESWLVDNNQAIIKPFAKVQLDLLRHRPHPPHTEDWIVSPEHKYYQGLLQEAERLKLLQKIVDPNVPAIFGAEIHREPGYYIERKRRRSLARHGPGKTNRFRYPSLL